MFLLFFTCLFAITTKAERHNGRTMCDSAREARITAKANLKYAIKPCRHKIPTFSHELREGVDIFTFHDQDVNSYVVEMNLDGIDVSKLIDRVHSVKQLKKDAQKFFNFSLWGYNPLSFQFSNAVMFYPVECALLWKNNKEIIKKHMPSVVRCHCNLFSVLHQNETFHMHHASAIGFHNRDLKGYHAREYQ